MLATRAVATLAAYIPFGYSFCPDVIVNGMAAVAQRSSRPFHILGRVERRPPIGPVLYKIRTPDLVPDIPLSRQREVVVTHLLEIALFPFASIYEGNVVLRESEKRIRFR